MELLFDNLRAACVSLMRWVGSVFLKLCSIFIEAVTLPPDHAQSMERLRSYRQCWHRPSFGGGAFIQARAV